MSDRPRRRLVIASALAAGLTTLAGCSVRLEDDAPNIPLIPTREPIPGETALLAVLGALEEGTEKYADKRSDLLREALIKAQIPAKVIATAAAPTSPAERVAAFEGAVRDCGSGLLQLMGQLAATQRILDTESATLWTAAPTTAWQQGKIAAEALTATRATSYALDLIAARAEETRAQRVRKTSASLDALSARQTTAAGDAVTPATLGYDIPHTLDRAAATQLGRRSFSRMLTAYADGFAGLDHDRTAALEVTQWISLGERISRSQFRLDVPVLYGEDSQQS